jgi:uncharacterized protein
MDEVLDRLRRAAPAAFDGEPVAFALLFGSQARGTAGPRSDVDVAVHLTAEAADVDHLDLRLRLAGALEQHAGVGPVEVVVLDDAPLPLAGRAVQEGQVLYSRDDVLRLRATSLTLRMFHDYQLRDERNVQQRLERLASGR